MTANHQEQQGRPILGQINSYGTDKYTNCCKQIFRRNFAWSKRIDKCLQNCSCRIAIENAEIVERTIHEYYEITFPFSSLNDVMKILKEENLGQSAAGI